MKKILITCFEPFAGEKTNSSMTVTALSRPPKGWELDRLVLPVVFSDAWMKVVEEAGHLRPEVILLTGQAGSRSYVSVEAMARNVRNASIPDNAGNMPVNEKIAVNAQEALATDVDAEAVVDEIRKKGVPARLSTDAGSFVCNDVYYNVLRYLRSTGAGIIFVHLPYVYDEELHPAGIAEDRLAAALQSVINYLTSEV